ncbi:hypothetical protein DFH09DRAFT_1084857 [Mycena vulgaris]|nr:hypothetical protein DFH09DRAFT_1084857 [Mycena vulgaris]
MVPGNASVAGARSKTKPKGKKTKEFSHSFESLEENYMSLLKMILLKHGEDKYNITKKMTYGIKVQLPGVNKKNSFDIDNLFEYQDLVKSIIEGLPNKMNIYIDMADIQKCWSGARVSSPNFSTTVVTVLTHTPRWTPEVWVITVYGFPEGPVN